MMLEAAQSIFYEEFDDFVSNLWTKKLENSILEALKRDENRPIKQDIEDLMPTARYNATTAGPHSPSNTSKRPAQIPLSCFSCKWVTSGLKYSEKMSSGHHQYYMLNILVPFFVVILSVILLVPYLIYK
ncbi:hypothetical protein L596_026907 [Steinernema carpocapsae]|nr:hypothetical protein L596_026907 [Steinernema carpocapsae]